MSGITIGILALQGCVEPHIPHLKALGVKTLLVKQESEFAMVDGYILPGGESSTMLRLMDHYNLKEPLKNEFMKKPCWGICAGAILMAKEVLNVKQYSFNLMNYSISRNAYGRQLDSHEELIGNYPVCYIRAPIISNLGSDVEVLASQGDTPVWVRSGNKMASSFHPELTREYPSPMHKLFVDLVKNSRK